MGNSTVINPENNTNMNDEKNGGGNTPQVPMRFTWTGVPQHAESVGSDLVTTMVENKKFRNSYMGLQPGFSKVWEVIKYTPRKTKSSKEEDTFDLLLRDNLTGRRVTLNGVIMLNSFWYDPTVLESAETDFKTEFDSGLVDDYSKDRFFLKKKGSALESSLELVHTVVGVSKDEELPIPQFIRIHGAVVSEESFYPTDGEVKDADKHPYISPSLYNKHKQLVAEFQRVFKDSLGADYKPSKQEIYDAIKEGKLTTLKDASEYDVVAGLQMKPTMWFNTLVVEFTDAEGRSLTSK